MFGYRTYRFLGLGIALGYAGLGTFAIAAPRLAAEQLLGLKTTSPLASPASSAAAAAAPEDKKAKKAKKEQEDDAALAAINTAMPLLGARDLSIFTTLMVFFHARQHSEMGVVILGGMVLCAADMGMVWLRKGVREGAMFLAGTLSCAWIGWKLYLEDF